MLISLLISLAIAIVILQVAVFSTTIYLHRAATHRALVLRPAVAWLFRAALWLTTGLNVRQWVAVHRKHHAFTDEEGDPHSPHLKGFWSVQFGNVFHYVREARDQEVLDKYARDIKEDWWERHVFGYGIAGPVIGVTTLCTICALGGLGIGWALLAGGVHGFLYVFVLSSSINGLCHYRGYRNFKNTATNIRLIALITGGEGLHNNHHGFPRSPRFSVRRKWSEIDPAWPIIWCLTKLRLAKPYRTIEEHDAPADAQPQET